MSIAQKILAEPNKYSIQELTNAVQNGVLPAYIGIPIIQSKVQEKKQAQMAQQAQGAGANQPPIAQQVMSEAQGVQSLPTNLPQNYAHGGIVAFEEGGPVQRFQVGGGTTAQVGQLGYEQLMKLYQTDPALAKEAALRAGPMGERLLAGVETAVRAGGVPLAVADLGTMATLKATHDLGTYTTPEQRRQIAANPMLSAMSGDVGLAGAIMNSPNTEKPTMSSGEQIKNALSFFPKTLISAPGDAQSPKGYGITRLLNSGDTQQPAATPTTTAAPVVAPETTSPVASDKGAPSSRGGISDLLSGLGINLGGAQGAGGAGGAGVGIKPPSNDLVGQTQSFVDAFNKRDEARTAENERRIQELQGSVKGKAYEGLEKSLQKEAEEFGADKAQAKNMAIFKAGLAMMAGTSRHALENIGKGAMVGAEDYQAAAKDIKKAQKENERAMAMVEQARRAEDIGNRDKAIDRMDRANQHLAERDKFGTTALMNATGKSAELSQDAWKTMMTNQTHLAAANISGKYHLASSILGSMGKDRNQTIQERRLQLQFEEKNPIADVRAAYAKQLGLSKVPAPGADKSFDTTVNQLYANKFQNFIGGTTYDVGGAGQGGANPYAGYKIVP